MTSKINPVLGKSHVFHQIVEGVHTTALDVFGPTVEFLTSPGDVNGDFCVLSGVMPSGVSVPLHSHEDAESFFLLSGTKQVLIETGAGFEWIAVQAGDYVQIPPGMRHAHRNHSGASLVELVITTAKLGRWFREVGRPLNGALQPPMPDDLARLAAVSARYGYWLATPEENAAVGIRF
jgi:quercetin dioxygenase-like cupin family protein